MFYNVGSTFLMKYLTCFNGLEMLDMKFNNSFANISFKHFSAKYTAHFTGDSLM